MCKWNYTSEYIHIKKIYHIIKGKLRVRIRKRREGEEMLE